MLTLDQTPIETIKGVGPAVAQKLHKLGIKSVFQLLLHLPLRYQDRTRITPIGAASPGDQIVIEGEVQLSEVVLRRKRMLLVRIRDGSGSLTLRFFRFSKMQQQALSTGTKVRCFGEIRRGAATLEMIHPEYKVVGADRLQAVEETLTPVYPTTEGLGQAKLRALINDQLIRLQQHPEELVDYLPVDWKNKHQQPDLLNTFLQVHRPSPETSLNKIQNGELPAQQRLICEELLGHHLSLRKLRQQIRKIAAPACAENKDISQQLLKQFGFEPTGAQQRVTAEILQDMAQPEAMMRLVQGDVGSGKTVVAAMAAAQAVANGYQAALMAPTELLAEQHARNFATWLEPLGWRVTLLSGRATGKKRETLLAQAHDAEVIIGTHALFQDDVLFAKLGLVIIDEQHRFGVHQRLALRDKGAEKGQQPHQLIMTATPIPRTLAMTAYADLDYSIIDELPPGRTPVKTVAIANTRRDEIIQRVHAACLNGDQVYWVCTLVEDSEVLEAEAAETTAEKLQDALPDLNVGLVHGRMKAAEKEAVMAEFSANKIHLLVATTVIEVGVDVPNASLMIIENAERLGLSQLHQLRGRVGRGSKVSSCVLTYQAPLGDTAKARLTAMRETNDGFEIARRDLKLRGAGEFMGTKQTGDMSYKIADLQRDAEWLPQIQPLADKILRENPAAADALITRWVGDSLRYADIG